MSKDKDPVSGEPRRRRADHNSADEESDLDCYSPLLEQSSIRLVRLMPHKDKKAPVQCQLFEYPLQEQGEGTYLYEALSYEWGSKDNRQPVYIQSDNESDCYPTAEMKRGFDGRSCPPAGNNRRLFVTENLHAALSHLRDRLVERIIWVDAICINQRDNNEKGQQIQFMASIYAKASHVIVWLGKAADNSDQALNVIREAAKEQSTNAAINETNEQAILTLLKRPWFQRIWVLQEVAAARRVLIKCGPTEIDGYTFCLGLSALQLSYETCPDVQEADEGALRVMDDLLIEDKGAAIEAKYKEYGQAPLSWAAGEGHEALVRLLVEKGAAIEAKDKEGRTPLSWAAAKGHEAVVRLLVEKGAVIEAKDESGW
ncbi:hypothetical protein DL767_010132 [Monosporascus sp. MG133]|nr:hypothetical protein DL767_010132 [Monosporascus sp. MG133]